MRRGRRREAIRLSVSLLVACVAVTGACGGGGDGERAQRSRPPGEVRVAAGEDVWPLWGPGPRSKTFAVPLNVNVYEPLVYQASDFSIRPGLAESWELVEPTTWRFHLRAGVQFHDGRPMTADDVVWSWTGRETPTRLVAASLPPDAVKKVDDLTVDFVAATPNFRLPEQLTTLFLPVLPRNSHADASPPVGTGPFRVVEYRPRQHVVLEPFDRYWGERATVRRVTFRFLPDLESRLAALKDGDVDVALEVSPDVAAGLAADERFHLVRSAPSIEHLLLLNASGTGLSADATIRHAVSLAVDGGAYAADGLKGIGTAGRAMAPTAVLGAAADRLEPPRHDPAEARRLLDGAGWRVGGDGIRTRDGRPLNLVLIGGPDVSDAALGVLQSQLRTVGIQTNVKHGTDRLTYDEYQLRPFDLDLHLFAQGEPTPLSIPAGVGYSKIPEARPFAPGDAFDAMVEGVLAERSPDEARARSVDLMRVLMHEARVVVPLAEVPQIYVLARGVDLADPKPTLGQQLCGLRTVR